MCSVRGGSSWQLGGSASFLELHFRAIKLYKNELKSVRGGVEICKVDSNQILEFNETQISLQY